MKRLDRNGGGFPAPPIHFSSLDFHLPRFSPAQWLLMSIAASEAESLIEPGQLLRELEQRQDEVLDQLDRLDAQLQEVLQGLGVTLDTDAESELA